MDPVWKFIVIPLLLVIIHPVFFKPSLLLEEPWVAFAFLFFVFVILDILFGTYLAVSDKEFSRVDYFIRKKRISLTSIRNIRYVPTWKFGQTMRSLVVEGYAGQEQKLIDVPNNGFAERNLAKIASELKRRNPSINVDEHTTELIKKYEHNGDRYNKSKT